VNATAVQHKDPRAVLGWRVGAFVGDFLIAGAIYWGSFFVLAEERPAAPTDAVRASLTLGDTTYAITGGEAALLFLAFLVIGFLYWSVLPGVTGWTLGKLAAGIRVVAVDGTVPAGIGRNLVRQLMGIADYFPYFIPGLTGFIVALASSDRRRVGDMVAGTYVVRRAAAGQPLGDTGRAGRGAGGAAGGSAPAGWYGDPQGAARLRYWDGAGWTEHASA
jgi:uncharacterized RDD family membrane protein YckC